MPPNSEQIEKALKVAAAVVARDGARFLPVFLAVEKLHDKAKADSEAIGRAQKWSQIYAD